MDGLGTRLRTAGVPRTPCFHLSVGTASESGVSAAATLVSRTFKKERSKQQKTFHLRLCIVPSAAVTPSGQHPNFPRRHVDSHPSPLVPRAAVSPSGQQPCSLCSQGKLALSQPAIPVKIFVGSLQYSLKHRCEIVSMSIIGTAAEYESTVAGVVTVKKRLGFL